MARREVDKEDLLRDATALVDRVELAAKSESVAGLRVVAGFRANGAASFFFGADPVYHFNAAGELRRAYCDGLLVKAERGRLVSLRRERSAEEVQLIRHEFRDAEHAEFLAQMQLWLQRIALAIDAGEYLIVGQVDRDENVVERVRQWLTGREAIVVAASPRV